ncbi:DUF2062 domain-containing protein [Desulfonema magnum]|uniref:DUF2062 n=1 Tax=Desulfonema magnum TaxID=45655 RepID=A0A975BPB5_9BACT|nr:DUF2062 domain-containing protein [Desulfonema magnum]QTA89168.1 DUF2062 [Desulfonema magnum]
MEKKNEHIGNQKSKFHTALKKTYDRLVKIRGQPREIALGFALGIFIGMSPSIGFQTPIAIFFASLLKWNKISAAVGVWISNPLTAPVIYGITYIIGATLLGINNTSKLSDDFQPAAIFAMLSKGPEIIWAMIIGGVIIGLPLAVMAYYFCYSAVQKYQEDIKRKLAKQKAKLAKQKQKLAKKREERKQKKKKKKKKDKVT